MLLLKFVPSCSDILACSLKKSFFPARLFRLVCQVQYIVKNQQLRRKLVVIIASYGPFNENNPVCFVVVFSQPNCYNYFHHACLLVLLKESSLLLYLGLLACKFWKYCIPAFLLPCSFIRHYTYFYKSLKRKINGSFIIL